MKTLVRGLPASSGRIRGKARVIMVPSESTKLEENEVLVTPITEPSMVVDIIEKAIAIVTDYGGLASHPAIVARELGLPCVVGTESATKVIVSGMEIVVDGDEGVIYGSD